MRSIRRCHLGSAAAQLRRCAVGSEPTVPRHTDHERLRNGRRSVVQGGWWLHQRAQQVFCLESCTVMHCALDGQLRMPRHPVHGLQSSFLRGPLLFNATTVSPQPPCALHGAGIDSGDCMVQGCARCENAELQRR
eukprot:366097-Chlamydomonas_euryale.AAC.33